MHKRQTPTFKNTTKWWKKQNKMIISLIQTLFAILNDYSTEIQSCLAGQAQSEMIKLIDTEIIKSCTTWQYDQL